MIDFYTTILKIISDYKLILRKNLPTTQCTNKMYELGIKRKSIKVSDEVQLYKIGMKILAELKKYRQIPSGKRSSNFYRGAEEFLQYLEKFFTKYRIEDNKVVHVGCKSSNALVSAIQLVSMPKEKITEDVIQQIKHYSEIVVAYGSEEQKKMLIEAVSVRRLPVPQVNFLSELFL